MVRMVEEATLLTYEKTDSVLEALILEANLIKKYQPPYNTKDKDDKSFLYVTITKEPFPRVLLTRGAGTYGPFPGARSLRAAYGLIRKLFPFSTHELGPQRSNLRGQEVRPQEFRPCFSAPEVRPLGVRGRTSKVLRPCFDYELGVCPGTCIGKVSRIEYKRTVRNIKLFFEGKKERVISNLEREMKQLAKADKFEEAGERKRQIFALKHIHDVALIKSENPQKKTFEKVLGSPRTSSGPDHFQKSFSADFRIEAYDIAHMSGKSTVGVMVVVLNGVAHKSGYRKFKIKGVAKDKPDDIANLKEVVTRRLAHAPPVGGWPLPDLIVADGGVAQKSAIEQVLKRSKVNIPVVSVVKDEHHKPKEILLNRGSTLGIQKVEPRLSAEEKSFLRLHKDAILLANSESHRFAIAYHKLLRNKKFLP